MAAQEKWYFTRPQLQNSPSRKCGLDADKELAYRQQAANLIQDMGQRLQVSQLCINTAIVYMHRFYAFHSFTHFHRNSIAAAALFLAAKVEEQPRKLEYVIKVAHVCLHRGEGANTLTQEQYQEQAQDLVFNENVLLQTLGFDVAIDHPHTHVVRTCHLVKAPKDLAQTSYFMASNSLHLTTMCLQYKPTVVACFCIHLASKWSNWAIPQSNEGRHWFQYVDKTVTQDLLECLTAEFLHIFDKCPSRLKRKMTALSNTSTGGSPHSGAQAQIASSPFDKKHNMDEIDKSFDKEYEAARRRPVVPGGYVPASNSAQPPTSQPTTQKIDYNAYREKREREERERRDERRQQAAAAAAMQTAQQPRPAPAPPGRPASQPAPPHHQRPPSQHHHKPHHAWPHKPPHHKPPHEHRHHRPPTERPDRPPTERPDRPSTERPDRPPTERPERPPTERPDRPPTERPDRPPTERPDRPERAERPPTVPPSISHPQLPQPEIVPQRTRPPSLFSPENSTTPQAAAAAAPRRPQPPPQRPRLEHREQKHPPPNIPPVSIPQERPEKVERPPSPKKRPEVTTAVKDMQPPAILSPFNSPPFKDVKDIKPRARLQSSSSEPELVPVVKKLEDTAGYENVIRDSQRGNTIKARMLEKKPEMPSLTSRSLNGIETDPTLVSNLLKESLAKPVPITVPTERKSPEIKREPVLPRPPVVQPPVQEPAPIVLNVAEEPTKHKKEKKKKEKHKHKDRDKSKEERKRHKKDKRKESSPVQEDGIKITIPREKLETPGLKIKIPKERLATATLPPPPPAQPSGLKIKISKEVLETSRKRGGPGDTGPPPKVPRQNGAPHTKVGWDTSIPPPPYSAPMPYYMMQPPPGYFYPPMGMEFMYGVYPPAPQHAPAPPPLPSQPPPPVPPPPPE